MPDSPGKLFRRHLAGCLRFDILGISGSGAAIMSLIRPRCLSGSRAIWPAAALLLGTIRLVGGVAAEPSSAADSGLFDRLDLNHDGAVNAAEVTRENHSLFERLLRRADANH